MCFASLLNRGVSCHCGSQSKMIEHIWIKCLFLGNRTVCTVDSLCLLCGCSRQRTDEDSRYIVMLPHMGKNNLNSRINIMESNESMYLYFNLWKGHIKFNGRSVEFSKGWRLEKSYLFLGRNQAEKSYISQ